MNKIIIGLVVLGVGVWMTSTWWWFILDIVKGLFAVGMVLVGLTLIGIGVKNGTGSAESVKEKV